MERNIFLKSEVIAYLEDKLLMDTATQEESELYADYKWTGKLKKGYTYKKVIAQMTKIHECGF